MPTFRNETGRIIDHVCIIQNPTETPKKVLIRFDPNKDCPLPFWVPYQKLGLTLVDADYPLVPNTILISGTYMFSEGQERKFSIESCDTYELNVIVHSGAVKVYTGNSATAVEVRADKNKPFDFKTILDWEFAPYVRVVASAASEVTVHAEVNREFPTKLK